MEASAEEMERVRRAMAADNAAFDKGRKVGAAEERHRIARMILETEDDAEEALNMILAIYEVS